MLCTKQRQNLQGIISRVRAGYFQVSKCHFVRAPSAPTCPLRRGFYSQGSLWGLQSRLSPTLDIGWKQSSKCYMLPCKHRLFDLSRTSLKQDRRVPSADGASKESSEWRMLPAFFQQSCCSLAITCFPIWLHSDLQATSVWNTCCLWGQSNSTFKTRASEQSI